jgi:hypothetical protein
MVLTVAATGVAASALAADVPPSASAQKKAAALELLGGHEIAAFTTAPQCFTSGSPAGSVEDPNGYTFLKICVSERGNITHFESPAGKVHLRGREGYAVCSGVNDSTVYGFDAGMAESGWGPPTVSQPNGGDMLPLTIERDSVDGVVRLTQTFTINAGARELQVKVSVKNLSAVAITPRLARYFDGDIDDTASDDRYDRSSASVWGTPYVTGAVNGLVLTQTTTLPVSEGVTQISPEKFSDWNPFGFGAQSARRCIGTAGLSVPTPSGDYVGRALAPLGTINPGETRTVTYRYRRF